MDRFLRGIAASAYDRTSVQQDVDLIGGAVYRWALIHRFDLRDRFVFLADEVTGDFDAAVGGRCLLVPTAALAELIHGVEATGRTAASLVDRLVLVANGPSPIADGPLGRPVFSKGDDAGRHLGALAHIAPRRP